MVGSFSEWAISAAVSYPEIAPMMWASKRINITPYDTDRTQTSDKCFSFVR
jgi:hypothetical protein